MNASDTRRPLEEMLVELVDGLSALPAFDGRGSPLSVTGIELALPIETRVVHDPGAGGAPVVLADLPRTRTRTAFDLPVGRFVLRLSARATETAR